MCAIAMHWDIQPILYCIVYIMYFMACIQNLTKCTFDGTFDSEFVKEKAVAVKE